MSMYLEDALPVVKYNGLNTNKNVDFSGATTVALPAGTTIAGTTAQGATTVTSTSATAFTVGANGATNPVFNINASTASVATGITVVGAGTGAGVAVTATDSGSDTNLILNAKGTGSLTLNATATGVVAAGAALSVTSASATSFAVGRLGATTPAFQVDSSAGTQVTGLSVTGAATGGTVAVAVIQGAGNANLTINAKGSGTIGIGSVSTGAVTITPATTVTGNLTVGASKLVVTASSGATSSTGAITSMNATAVAAAASVTPAFLTSSTALLGLFVGTGSPNTALTAAQGSLYLRTDGSSTSTRAYINTDGSTAWTAVTTVA